MTTNQPRKEFVNSNDKYNRTTISIDLYRGPDAEKFRACVERELKKITGSEAVEVHLCPGKGVNNLDRVVGSIEDDMSTKTCLTIAERLALLHPVMTMVLTGQVCYYPEYACDEDNDELYGAYTGDAYYYVDMLSVTYSHGTGCMGVSQLPFYYFESIRENHNWMEIDGQVHINEVVNLMHNIGRETNEDQYFIPDGENGLNYESVADRMEICVMLPKSEAHLLKDRIDEDNDGAEYTVTIFNAKDCDGGRIYTVTITRNCRNECRGAACRMAFLHWILHNFHVQSLMGNGYARIPLGSNIGPEHTEWMPVERYDYVKGKCSIGRLAFNVIDPELVKYTAGFRAPAICQIIGEALYDTHKHTKDSETMYVLVRPASEPGPWHVCVPGICNNCGMNDWAEDEGFLGPFCTKHNTRWMVGHSHCDDWTINKTTETAL